MSSHLAAGIRKAKQLFSQRYERLPEKEKDERDGDEKSGSGASRKQQGLQLTTLDNDASAKAGAAHAYPVAVVSLVKRSKHSCIVS